MASILSIPPPLAIKLSAILAATSGMSASRRKALTARIKRLAEPGSLTGSPTTGLWTSVEPPAHPTAPTISQCSLGPLFICKTRGPNDRVKVF
jgi:hypothetical protein